MLSGEDQGVRWLIEQFQDVVFGLCLRMMRHRQDAEDVMQETFLRAVRGIGSFDTSRPLRPWILGIAANRCRSALSKRARQPCADRTVARPGRTDRPTITDADDLADELEKALEHLRPDYRLVFLLFHEHGMSYEEISDNLGRPHRHGQNLAPPRPGRTGPAPEPTRPPLSPLIKVVSPMNCREFEHYWNDWVDQNQRFPQLLDSPLSQHAAICPDCCACADAYLKLSKAFVGWTETPHPRVPQSLSDRITVSCLQELAVPAGSSSGVPRCHHLENPLVVGLGRRRRPAGRPPGSAIVSRRPPRLAA